ncbi:MAG: Peptidoglycan-N-acetylglucosamine deacetylase [Firmicutes bacterium ADurb.Bin456]|nr:MAG: Peptidoglycan-N-acetylglucosamine deacetylase [Firmicutes bacterium ADurb.Bin456]
MLYKYAMLFLLNIFLLSGCNITPPASLTPPGEPLSLAEAAPAAEPEPEIPPESLKKVYLTFDDGPNSYYTGLILDILKDYGVKASFAVLGVNIDKNPAVLQRILDEGHGIINHSYSHDYTKVYSSPRAFLEELELCNKSIEGITGSSVKIFRAPGGPAKISKETFDLLRQYGYISISWNVASADTDPRGVSKEQVLANVQNGVKLVESINKTPIILMHDGTEINRNGAVPGSAVANFIRSRESVVAALPEIIEFLREQGYTFAVVDENTPPAW